MKTLLSILRYTWVTAWYTIATLIVLLAVLFSGMRLLLPHAVDYRDEIQAELSRYIGQPVHIDSLDAEWRGLEPSLVLKDVTLLDAGGETEVLQFQKIRLGLDWLASLVLREVVFSDITLVGLDLTLTKFADGHIALQGLAGKGGDRDLDALTGWLFSQGELRIEDSRLTWIDQRLANPPRLQLADVNVLLRNEGDRHWLDVSLSLPEDAGESLSLAVEMQGDPLTPEKGRATRIHVAGTAINFAGLLPGLQIAGIEAGIKDADFQLWMGWRNGGLEKVQGRVDLKSITLASGQGRERVRYFVDELGGRLRWQRQAAGWRFDADDLVLASGKGLWLPSRVALSYGQAEAAGDDAASPAQLDLAASFLRLDRLGELLPLLSRALPAEEGERQSVRQLLQALRAMQPRGEVYDLRAKWQAGEVPRLRAYARFEGLGSKAWNELPSVTDAAGRLWLRDHGGQVQLERAALTVDLPKLFRAPLPLDYLSGQIAWRNDAGDWQLVARDLRAGNRDIRTRTTLDLRKTADHPSPFISLVSNFSEADGSQVPRYLPVGIMGPHTVAWLDHAIRDGHVSDGGVILHGRLADFPYEQGNGHFEVRFQVQDALLDYAEGWPPIADINAEVLFRGRAMAIEAERGRIFRSSIRWARVAIEDMAASSVVVTVRGDIDGPTQEKLDYLMQSPPLNRKFGQYLDILRAEGNSLLSLDMALPIQHMEDSRVSGTVKMDDNALSVSPLGEVLSHARGTLRFSADGLRAEGMTADLLGQPVVLNIFPTANGQTRLRATGRFDAADLGRRYLPQVADLLTGGSEWDVRLDVPMGGDPSAPPQATVLRVESSLLGLASRLPSPLEKAADDPLPLKLQVNFPPGGEPLLQLAYGGFLSGVFEFGEGGPLGLHRGELRFSGDAAVLPGQPGLRIVGWLDRFSLDAWDSILGDGGGNGASWLLSTDVAVREAEAFGQTLHNLQLKVVPEEWYWQARVDSRELKGLLRIPRGDVHRPLVAELDYCRLDALQFSADPEATVDPRRLPPLKVRISDLRYKQRRYGSLQLETVPVHNGLKIKQLVLKPKKTRLTAGGGWFVQGGEPYSKFDIEVQSEDLEESLRVFGYLDSIRSGRGTVKLSLQWPGSPAAMNDHLELVRGRVSMDLRNGQLLEVDPGAGRLFGLLSLQTLPRRLLLDFADVFREGFRFDRIRGDFLIEDGDAYTSNLYMVGPAARVDITGRTGLVAKDYDQLVTVTPKVSETLPLIGALALTPQIGAAILFVQKIMEPQINKATQVKYSITGPWAAPKVVKLE